MDILPIAFSYSLVNNTMFILLLECNQNLMPMFQYYPASNGTGNSLVKIDNTQSSEKWVVTIAYMCLQGGGGGGAFQKGLRALKFKSS